MKGDNAKRIRKFVMENPTACNHRITRATGLKLDQVRRAIASDVGRDYMNRSEVDGLRWLTLTPAGRNTLEGRRNGELNYTTASKVKMRHPGQAKRRKCLQCGDPFNSEGPGNRICKPCKSSSEYRSAVA